MHRLLMATDLSPGADRALDRALLLARQLGAPLCVLHVVDPALPPPEAARVRSKALTRIRRQLDAQPAARGIAATLEVVPAASVAEAVERREVAPTMVVLGEHREDVLKDLFSRSTAAQLLRALSASLLVVRERPLGPYRRVLVGVDFSPASRRALEYALALLPDTLVWVVHACDLPRAHDADAPAERAPLESFFEEDRQRFFAGLADARRLRLSVRVGEAPRVLSAAAAEFEADLLVVGAQGRGALEHALVGSVSDALMQSAPCDVLVTR